jgi:hypothetical protein
MENEMENDMKIEINGKTYVPEVIQMDVGCEGLPYVVVRSRGQGVMTGYLKSRIPEECILLQARQIWSWRSEFVLVEFANTGPITEDPGKMSEPLVGEMCIVGYCGIYECTKLAGERIRAVKSYKGNNRDD